MGHEVTEVRGWGRVEDGVDMSRSRHGDGWDPIVVIELGLYLGHGMVVDLVLVVPTVRVPREEGVVVLSRGVEGRVRKNILIEVEGVGIPWR
jgi:hypothetical protein